VPPKLDLADGESSTADNTANSTFGVVYIHSHHGHRNRGQGPGAGKPCTSHGLAALPLGGYARSAWDRYGSKGWLTGALVSSVVEANSRAVGYQQPTPTQRNGLPVVVSTTTLFYLASNAFG